MSKEDDLNVKLDSNTSYLAGSLPKLIDNFTGEMNALGITKSSLDWILLVI